MLQLDHLAVMASDISQSTAFYGALLPLLGFEPRDERTWKDSAGMFVQLREAKPDSRAYERFGPGVNHLGFAAPSRAFVTEVRDAMASAGFVAPDLQEFGETLAVFFKDPDGLRIELSHSPPGVDPVD